MTHSNPPTLEARLARVERNLDRLIRSWIAWHLSSPTSSPTAPTCPTETATGTRTATPTLMRHARKYVPKFAGWVAERALGYLAPWFVALAGAAWAMGRERLDWLWTWVASCWRWLFG